MAARQAPRRCDGFAGDVVEELREACRETVTWLQQLHVVDYSADALVETGEYMAVPLRVVQEEDSTVLDLLRRAAALDRLDAAEIPTRLWFYAAVIGDDPDERVAFVRKTDPHKVARPGKILTTLGDVLSRIDDPVFVLEHRFDLVVLERGLAVINPVAFETLFRGAPGLVRRIPEWARAITDHLPVADGGAERLVEACVRDSRLARRLRAIHEQGHLSSVSIGDLRQEMREQDLDEEELISDGELVIDERDPGTLLRLLNEDLFVGGLSGRRFAADRKRVR